MNTLNSTWKLGVVGALLLVGLVGCGTPKIMLSDSFLPGTNKVVRESLKQAGAVGSGDSEVQLTNYYIQICDVNGSEQSNCKTTLVLSNITNYAIQPRL